MTANILEKSALRLRAAGIESPRLEARLLLAHAAGMSQEDLIACRVELEATALHRFEELLARRMAREPLAYIIGCREFWSLDFAVGPGVLIPRPETETLVEEALREFPVCEAGLRVLDLGTGTCCLLIAFLKERPQAIGIGIDISAKALHWAGRNARAYGMADRVTFIQGCWAEAVEGRFEVIFCNPPYIADAELALLDPEVAHAEPHLALAGGVDGLDAYRQLAPQIREHLAPRGRAFVEIGKGHAADVTELFRKASLNIVRIVPDLAQILRCVVLKLTD